tara:strand:- start:62 stop:208 length:147 start_codon:yes stop_codon:yes gene_type:complete
MLAPAKDWLSDVQPDITGDPLLSCETNADPQLSAFDNQFSLARYTQLA